MTALNVIVSKFKEVLFSVLPITVMVLILNFTISPMETPLIIRFLIGSLFVVLGLTIFLLGIDIGITPLGDLTGSSLAKSNKLWIVLIGGLILGFFISIAEPGLMVLANQVDLVTSGQIPGISILVIVSIGLAILLALGFLRVFYNVHLYKILIILYLIEPEKEMVMILSKEDITENIVSSIRERLEIDKPGNGWTVIL